MSSEHGVSLYVENTMRNQIKEVVYREYFPKRYQRREYGSGGLISKESIRSSMSRNTNRVRLTTENIAKANTESPYNPIEGSSSQYLTPLIVYGHGGAGGKYSWGDTYPYSYVKPRDFISATRRKLKDSGMHVTGLSIALDDMGVENTTH